MAGQRIGMISQKSFPLFWEVGEQDHAAANVCGIQVRKLATQQIGDELQLQENEFNIANIIMPEITSNERCIEIYLLEIWPYYIGNSHTNESIPSDSYTRQPLQR